MQTLSALHPVETTQLRQHVERANQYRSEGGRLMVDHRDGRHYAASTSKPGTTYYVTLASCTCMGFVAHHHCKHHSALTIAHLMQMHDDPALPTGDLMPLAGEVVGVERDPGYCVVCGHAQHPTDAYCAECGARQPEVGIVRGMLGDVIGLYRQFGNPQRWGVWRLADGALTRLADVKSAHDAEGRIRRSRAIAASRARKAAAAA